MQTLPQPGLGLRCFLASVDWLGAALGVNIPPIVDLEYLRSLPPTTLGRTLANFLHQHQLSPLATGPRRKQSHDAVHALTGYGADAIGEAEVQAFLLGAKFRLAHVVLGLGLLSLMLPSLHQTSRRDRLWHAYCRGQASRFDVGTWRPEDQWHLPLAQIQNHYGIAPLSGIPAFSRSP
jgi:ubiquinone biosynthesis protein COQ4